MYRHRLQIVALDPEGLCTVQVLTQLIKYDTRTSSLSSVYANVFTQDVYIPLSRTVFYNAHSALTWRGRDLVYGNRYGTV